VDAARGMGMSRMQILFRVEIPLAARVILAGVRISVIINIGTAMIGAVIAAGGLGSPIIAGLVQNNLAYLIEGAVPAALLAILIDQLMSNIEASFAYLPAPESV
jgi:osmoprotectant transport system permease protein